MNSHDKERHHMDFEITKKCKSCGADIPRDASFCDICGAPVTKKAAKETSEKAGRMTIWI